MCELLIQLKVYCSIQVDGKDYWKLLKYYFYPFFICFTKRRIVIGR